MSTRRSSTGSINGSSNNGTSRNFVTRDQPRMQCVLTPPDPFDVVDSTTSSMKRMRHPRTDVNGRVMTMTASVSVPSLERNNGKSSSVSGLSSKKNSSVTTGTIPALLERLRLELDEASLDVDAMRIISSRIHCHAASQERPRKELLLKKYNGVGILVAVLEKSDDLELSESIAVILNTLATSSGRNAALMVARGVTSVLFKVLHTIGRCFELKGDHLSGILVGILAELSVKDKKIAVLARLSGVIPLIVTAVKASQGNSRFILPPLRLLKAICTNSHSAIQAGRAGASAVMLALIMSYSDPPFISKDLQALRLVLSVLMGLSGSRTYAAVIIEKGGMVALLQLYAAISKYDSRNRLIDVRRTLLQLFKNLIQTTATGRQTFIAADGVTLMYDSTRTLTVNPESEGLLYLIAIVLRCAKSVHADQVRIPLGCYKYQLPESLNNNDVDAPIFMPEAILYAARHPNSHQHQDCEALEATSTKPIVHPTLSVHRFEYVLDARITGFGRLNVPLGHPEYLWQRPTKLVRSLAIKDIEAIVHPEWTVDQIIYDSVDNNPDSLWVDSQVSSSHHVEGNVKSDSKRTSSQRQQRHRKHRNLSQSGNDRNTTNATVASTVPTETTIIRTQRSIETAETHMQSLFRTEDDSIATTPTSTALSKVVPRRLLMYMFPMKDYLSSSTSDSLTVTGASPMIVPRVPFSANIQIRMDNIADNSYIATSNFSSIMASSSSAPASATDSFKEKVNDNFTVLEGQHQIDSTFASTTSIPYSLSCCDALLSGDYYSRMPLPSVPVADDGWQKSVLYNDERKEEENYDEMSGVEASTSGRSILEFSSINAQTSPTSILGPLTKHSSSSIYRVPITSFASPRRLLSDYVDENKGKCFRAATQDEINVLEPPLPNILCYEEHDSHANIETCDPKLSISNTTTVEMKDSSSVQSTDPTIWTPSTTSLTFESRFESGNLRRAIRINEREYDIVLAPDINCTTHIQWFFFRVENMVAGEPYKFNIINFEKPNSQFNFGMQPVFYSVEAATARDIGWIRGGDNILYYRNHYMRPSSDGSSSEDQCYYTLTFTYIFEFNDDTCFIAYHFPYTYSALQLHLQALQLLPVASTRLRRQTLCYTIGGNAVDLLTITAFSNESKYQYNYKTLRGSSVTTSVEERHHIFVTARVHPGESNASWMMNGLLKFLLGPSDIAFELMRKFVFKIVPMLNPDGVINGHHRCSLNGEDLNRQWPSPNPLLQPTVYHTKRLLNHLIDSGRRPLIFCDFHGHSRKKNVFIYGCNDPTTDYALEQTFPKLLHERSRCFSFKCSRFSVEKSKESTARVVMWRSLGLLRSYTMEATYCGIDQGPYRDLQINTSHLEEMGGDFAEALLTMLDSATVERINETLRQNSVNGGISDESRSDDSNSDG